MKVKIFTEGGNGIGLGHVSRCTALFDEISKRNVDVVFFVYGDIRGVSFINDKNVVNCDWISHDYLDNNIESSDICIVDSYLANQEIYQFISEKSYRALYIDDENRLNYPNGIIVNPALNTNYLNYDFTNDSIYLLGSQYIILRTPFSNVPRKKVKIKVENVLVVVGGSDIRNLIPIIIESICAFYPQIKFTILVENEHKANEYVNHRRFNNIKFVHNINAEEMKALMLEADLAISGAGQTIHELMVTRTPFIPIKIIDNQTNNINCLKLINIEQVFNDYNDNNLANNLQHNFRFMLNYEVRNYNISLYNNIVDGLGCVRIIDELLRK